MQPNTPVNCGIFLVMVNVSKKPLSPQLKTQLANQFVTLFTSPKKDDVGALFQALFTESEKVVFVKRLAAAWLVQEGYSNYAIAKQLKLSGTTVGAIRADHIKGRFDVLVTIAHDTSFNKKEFWETIELLLRGGLPPYGKDRWKWLHEK